MLLSIIHTWEYKYFPLAFSGVENMKKFMTVILPKELIEHVDNKRGLVKRSTYIQALLWIALDHPEKVRGSI